MPPRLLGYPFSVSDRAPLWRYMDLGKLVLLLSQRRLFFAALSSFEDRQDGRVPDDLAARVAEAIEDFYPAVRDSPALWRQQLEVAEGNEAEARERMNALLESLRTIQWSVRQRSPDEFRGLVAANCWHQQKTETIPMWEIYGGRDAGVAVVSSVRRLAASIDGEIVIGRVRYGITAADLLWTSPGSLPKLEPLHPAFIKDRPFRHEREVRAVIPLHRQTEAGVSVPCDVDTLIQRIVISPLIPAHVGDAIVNVVKAFAPSIPVHDSALASHYSDS